MESIRGKETLCIDAATLAARIAGYRAIAIDIGTGDGRYVRHIAEQHPSWFVVGIDACRENLRAVTRAAPENALFIIANALALPCELDRLATRITVNFPWGSLLTGLLNGDPALFGGLVALARPGATLEIRLNGGALVETGETIAGGVMHIREALCTCSFAITRSAALDASALRACPSTWAKRLAYGRDPSGWYLSATKEMCARRVKRVP
jgi:16S rRNA (adenine(1408)-N(1))-methyltransferase